MRNNNPSNEVVKVSLFIVLCLLTSCALARPPSGDETVTWEFKTPEQIQRTATRMGHGKGVIAMAYPWQRPCRIVTSRPPAIDAPIAVVREYIHTLNHELRHCREGAFHPPNLAEPR